MTTELDAVVKSDYERISFTFYNPDGSIRDITGETIHFYAKRHVADTTALVHKDNALTGGVVVSNPYPPKGTYHGFVIINPADLASITGDVTLVAAFKNVDSSANPSTTEFDLPVRVTAGS